MGLIENEELNDAYGKISELKDAMQEIKEKLKHAQIILCERGDLACGTCFNCKELNKVLAYSCEEVKE